MGMTLPMQKNRRKEALCEKPDAFNELLDEKKTPGCFRHGTQTIGCLLMSCKLLN